VKVFISADIEGITGVVDSDLQTGDGGKDYERARRLMTGDVNAAIAGAFEAGATEVVVSDGHGASRMRNLLIEEIDTRADLVVGSPKPLTQMEGVDSTYGVAMFVGYHARASSNGILSHTISGKALANVWINGVAVGETGLNASIAGGFGVAVGLVTGDQCVAAEASELLPWVDTVVVKQAITRTAARCMAPGRTRPMIQAAASETVKKARAGAYKPLTFDAPLEYKVEFHNSGLCDSAARAAGVERVDAITLAFSAPDPISGFKILRSLVGLAQ